MIGLLPEGLEDRSGEAQLMMATRMLIPVMGRLETEREGICRRRRGHGTPFVFSRAAFDWMVLRVLMRA